MGCIILIILYENYSQTAGIGAYDSKDFIAICEENNIEYFIYGRQCISALDMARFIPWDDDIDIIMF